jgi:voltage-gated potassium channel
MPVATRMRPRRSLHIRYALFALAAAIVFGTVGFHLVEGWTLADSLYVTIQTLTTVGYGDLTPHSGTGRLFAVVVMLIGAGGVALAVSTIVQSVVKWELVSTFGQRRLTRKMSKLRDHYIISIRRRDGQVVFNPAGNATIENGDILIAIGQAESLTRLNQMARGVV